MSEFDEKLNALLSNPESMAQVMQLAQSLSSQNGGDNPAQEKTAAQPPLSGSQVPDAGLFSSLDPKLMGRLLPLLQGLNSERNTQARNLLYALRPYLKSERQEKVERALQLARLIHLGKKFIAGWGDRGV